MVLSVDAQEFERIGLPNTEVGFEVIDGKALKVAKTADRFRQSLIFMEKDAFFALYNSFHFGLNQWNRTLLLA